MILKWWNDPRLEQRLVHAEKILLQYHGEEPFHLKLKAFFKENSKYGSKDRRIIKDMCYALLRLGYAYKNEPFAKKIQLAKEIRQFAIEDKQIFKNSYLDYLNQDLFLNDDDISNFIEKESLKRYYLENPKVFYWLPNNDTNILENGVSEKGTNLNKNAIIQDLSSQRAIKEIDFSQDKLVLDVCAGAGGKSLILSQLFPNVSLVATDSRKNSLKNLELRFNKAGLQKPQTHLCDWGKNFNSKKIPFNTNSFDALILDVPCSGSGTWRRNPEAIRQHKEQNLAKYINVQTDILNNAFNYLKKGGKMVYLTCSIFSKENEQQIEKFLNKNAAATLLENSYINCLAQGGDIIFRAVIQK